MFEKKSVLCQTLPENLLCDLNCCNDLQQTLTPSCKTERMIYIQPKSNAENYSHTSSDEFELSESTYSDSPRNNLQNELSTAENITFELRSGTHAINVNLKIPANLKNVDSDLKISMNRLIESDYLLEWLLSKSRIFKIPVEILSAKLEIYITSYINKAEEYIRDNSALPLPLISYSKDCQMKYYFIDVDENFISSEEFLKIINHSERSSCSLSLFQKHIVMDAAVKSFSNEPMVEEISVKVSFSGPENTEWISYLKNIVLINHLKCGLLQNWILKLHKRKYKNLAVSFISQNLELRRASQYEMSVLQASFKEDIFILLSKQATFFYLFYGGSSNIHTSSICTYINFTKSDIKFILKPVVIKFMQSYLSYLNKLKSENPNVTRPQLTLRTVDEINALIDDRTDYKIQANIPSVSPSTGTYIHSNDIQEALKSINKALEHCFCLDSKNSTSKNVFTQKCQWRVNDFRNAVKKAKKRNHDDTFPQFLRKIYFYLRERFSSETVKEIMMTCLYEKLSQYSLKSPKIFTSLLPLNESTASGVMHTILEMINENLSSCSVNISNSYDLEERSTGNNLKSFTNTSFPVGDTGYIQYQVIPQSFCSDNLGGAFSVQKTTRPWHLIDAQSTSNSRENFNFNDLTLQYSKLYEAIKLCSNGQIKLNESHSTNPDTIQKTIKILDYIASSKSKKGDDMYTCLKSNLEIPGLHLLKSCTVKLDRSEVQRYFKNKKKRQLVTKRRTKGSKNVSKGKEIIKKVKRKYMKKNKNSNVTENECHDNSPNTICTPSAAGEQNSHLKLPENRETLQGFESNTNTDINLYGSFENNIFYLPSIVREGEISTDMPTITNIEYKLEPEVIEIVDQESANSDNLYKCTYKKCKQILYTKDEFLRHTSIHQSSVVQFTCPVCGMLFVRKPDLAEHWMRKHKTVKTFKCSSCGKAFYQEKFLKAHINKHHS